MIKKTNLILIKIGGSIITHKNSNIPKANPKNIKNIAQELAHVYQKFKNTKLILIHGAGSFGHPIAQKTKIHLGLNNQQQLIAMAETQRLQNDLNSIFTKQLIKLGLPAFHVQASATAITQRRVLKKMDTHIIQELLKLNLIPVLNGVPAVDLVQGCSILSGDDSGLYLAKKLKINHIIFVTSVDGIFDQDPLHSKNTRLIKQINPNNLKEIIAQMKQQNMVTHKNKPADVTGEMLNKILEIKKLSRSLPQHHLTCHIVNGNTYGNIIKAIKNQPVGTTIKL